MAKTVCHNKNMLIIKKLLFAIPLLILFYLFNFLLLPYFKKVYLIFGLNSNLLIDLIILSVVLLLTAIFYTIFITLAVDWKLILPIIIISSVAPIIIFTQPISFILMIGYLISFGLIFVTLNNKLAKYLTFEATNLLNPPIKNIILLLLLVTSFGFYLTASFQIKQKGFEVPDSLIEASLKLVNPTLPQVQGIKIAQVPQVTQEQIEFLKQNPELLKQYGIDPSDLDSINSTPQPNSRTTQKAVTPTPAQTSSDNFLKSLVKAQFQKMIEPYIGIIPPILALIFFFTLQFFVSILSIFNPLIINGIFYILTKSNFVKFTTEMREVKKLVV
jgi:hypothetical protein